MAEVHTAPTSFILPDAPIPDWREAPDEHWAKALAISAKHQLMLREDFDPTIVDDETRSQQWLEEHDLDQFFHPGGLKMDYLLLLNPRPLEVVQIIASASDDELVDDYARRLQEEAEDNY